MPVSRILNVEHNTDAFDEAIRGYVRCERINDVVAALDSKRYGEYMNLVRDQAQGEPVIDPNDQYREADERLRLIERAREHYELRHGVTLARGRIYLHDNFPVACAPDAVESDLIVIQVHVRESLDTYRNAVARGIDNDMWRVSQAQIILTGCPFALHLNYFEDAELAKRALAEHDVKFDRRRAEELKMCLVGFANKSRAKQAAVA